MLSFRSKILPILKKFSFWIVLFLGLVIIVFNEDEAVEPLYSLSVFFFFVVMGFWAIRWIVIQRRAILTLKQEQQQTELQHLKSQVNPHFFFNMLNNLYGSIETDPKKAKDLVLKLSELMRYSIYEGENEWVPVAKEVEYIRNFIELHKARYRKEIDVQFINDVDSPEFEIMPLMFINLVENAFKHGVENLRNDAFVHISLSLKSGELDFKVMNNFDPDIEKEESGIGLQNLRRRLQLVYPKSHSLELEIRDDVHRAQLTIAGK